MRNKEESSEINKMNMRRRRKRKKIHEISTKRKKSRLKRRRISKIANHHGENLEEDRLSSLPDSLILHIFSFLPAIYLVRTTILSPRFRDLWLSVDTLSIDDSRYRHSSMASLERFFRFVDRLLCRRRRLTLEKFSLKLCHVLDNLFITDRQLFNRELGIIHGWISSGVHRKPKILHLSFKRIVGCCKKRHILPHCVWNCDSAIELRLENFQIESKNGVPKINMASLRVLTLVGVSMEDGVFQDIIRGCPALRELNLEYVSLSRISFNNPGIQKLKLKDSIGFREREVDCPNLSSLYLYGNSSATKFVNVSSLCHAKLDVVFDSFDSFTALMEKFKHVNSLELSESFLRMSAFAVLKDLSCVQNYSRRLALNVSVTYVKGLFAFLRSSVCLEELTIKINSRFCSLPGVDPCFNDITSELESFRYDDQSELIIEDFDPVCLRDHLKRITIYGYEKSTCDIVLCLSEVLLRSAVALDEFVIKGKFYKEGALFTEDGVGHFCRHIISFPKASRTVKVKWLNY